MQDVLRVQRGVQERRLRQTGIEPSEHDRTLLRGRVQRRSVGLFDRNERNERHMVEFERSGRDRDGDVRLDSDDVQRIDDIAFGAQSESPQRRCDAVRHH